MKVVLLILFISFSVFSNAQQNHLKAYRLVNPHTDGPCSVKTYVQYEETDFFFTFVTADSDDQELIGRLLEVKKQSKKWNSRPFRCEDSFSSDEIPDMFVISGAVTDTIFTNVDNREIIFPDESRAYYDEENMLESAFTGIVKEFFDYDFKKSIWALFLPEKDSISIDNIFYKEKPIANSLKYFKRDLEGFKLISTDSVYGGIEKLYTCKKDTISISERDFTIMINDLKSDWVVDNTRVGMSESELFIKYPVSTKIKLFSKTKFEDIKREYFYWLGVANTDIHIVFKIKDNIIDSIMLSFNDEILSD
ncbi:hypothetical protein [Flavobacterium coralii]|uniref:hypothetical protein n=1 Tax=Flavobacterium coralii TaxID=2838017 RepID=UPI000C569034|nr:hypothetical protein [Flavobacterium sp.]|tara:strand:- start:53572 stop:54492 length:921 start_codon:yes stop_codon:yes gene_type:complete